MGIADLYNQLQRQLNDVYQLIEITEKNEKNTGLFNFGKRKYNLFSSDIFRGRYDSYTGYANEIYHDFMKLKEVDDESLEEYIIQRIENKMSALLRALMTHTSRENASDTQKESIRDFLEKNRNPDSDVVIRLKNKLNILLKEEALFEKEINNKNQDFKKQQNRALNGNEMNITQVLLSLERKRGECAKEITRMKERIKYIEETIEQDRNTRR